MSQPKGNEGSYWQYCLVCGAHHNSGSVPMVTLGKFGSVCLAQLNPSASRYTRLITELRHASSMALQGMAFKPEIARLVRTALTRADRHQIARIVRDIAPRDSQSASPSAA